MTGIKTNKGMGRLAAVIDHRQFKRIAKIGKRKTNGGYCALTHRRNGAGERSNHCNAAHRITIVTDSQRVLTIAMMFSMPPNLEASASQTGRIASRHGPWFTCETLAPLAIVRSNALPISACWIRLK